MLKRLLNTKKIENKKQRKKMNYSSLKKKKPEILLMHEKTDHNIVKEYIRQFDDSKGLLVLNTRQIYSNKKQVFEIFHFKQ